MAQDNSPQELAFKNRFVRYLNQTAPSLPNPTPENIYTTNTAPVLVQYTQEEWLKVYSALLSGADLLYPAEAHEVAYLFTQWWDNYMTICNYVAECIATSGAVQSALEQWFKDNGQPSANGGGLLLPPEAIIENLLPTGWVCDEPHAYGMAEAIVRYLDGEFVSLLAQIEVATNRIEAIALVVDNNQVTAIAGTALEFGAWLQDTLTEIYDAANNETTLLALICDLYCVIKDTCTVSLETLTAWAGRNATVEPTVNNLIDIMTAMTVTYGAGLPSREVVAGAFWMVIQLQRVQSIVPSGLGILGIQDIILLSQDETDNGYLICDACPEPPPPCGYTVTDGTPITDGASQSTTALVGRIDGVAGNAYARRVSFSYVSVQESVRVVWDVGSASGDGIYISDGVTLWSYPLSVTGDVFITLNNASSGELVIDRGYSGSASAYAGQTLSVQVFFCPAE